jgi:predicted nucleic acid-binding protein
MYLLDTNALSELRKRRSGKMSPAVEAWAGSVDQADMYLSVITIMEIELGIALLERCAARGCTFRTPRANATPGSQRRASYTT